MAKVVNGVDVQALGQAVKGFQEKPDLGRFQFKVTNRWEEGGDGRTEIDEFYGAGETHTSDSRPFHLRSTSRFGSKARERQRSWRSSVGSLPSSTSSRTARTFRSK